MHVLTLAVQQMSSLTSCGLNVNGEVWQIKWRGKLFRGFKRKGILLVITISLVNIQYLKTAQWLLFPIVTLKYSGCHPHRFLSHSAYLQSSLHIVSPKPKKLF